MHRIESRANERLKDIRRLRRSKGAREGRLLLEGPHLLETALDLGIEPETVLATDEFLARAPELIERLRRPPLVVAAGLLDELADADSPRGLLAVVPAPAWDLERLPRGAGTVLLFLDRLQDPGNLGALARVAEAAGVAGMALAPGTVDPGHPRALRGSAGSLLRLPVARDVSVQALRDHLADSDPTWVALVPRGGRDPFRAALPQTAVLLLGAEGPGLEDGVRAASSLELTIPVAKPVESLNVVVSAAVVLFELRRQRVASSSPS